MKSIIVVVLVAMVWAVNAWAGSVGSAVEVRIITDEGRTLPVYPVKTKRILKKVYAEAVKGDHYRIQVKNLLNRRVGLVVAVDGRNIISGEKSYLKNNERMYVLEPYESAEYSGWRTGDERVNRFYFTDVPDSYAAAFGDESAMGVITVAAYPELLRYETPVSLSVPAQPPYERLSAKGFNAADRAAAAPAPAAKAMKKAARSEVQMESAGTGYGQEEYSPVRTVSFEAERKAVETIHIKYEWRSTLCRLGIVNCELPPRRHPNRLWDNGGYAPPPPGRS